jgi:hypothetical protein
MRPDTAMRRQLCICVLVAAPGLGVVCCRTKFMGGVKINSLRTVVSLLRSISVGVSGANFVTALLNESRNGIEGG